MINGSATSSYICHIQDRPCSSHLICASNCDGLLGNPSLCSWQNEWKTGAMWWPYLDQDQWSMYWGQTQTHLRVAQVSFRQIEDRHQQCDWLTDDLSTYIFLFQIHNNGQRQNGSYLQSIKEWYRSVLFLAKMGTDIGNHHHYCWSMYPHQPHFPSQTLHHQHKVTSGYKDRK